MTFVESILKQMPGVAKPQRGFLMSLLTALTMFVGRANMTNLHRHGAPCARTQYRWHRRSFDWTGFNRRLLDHHDRLKGPVALAIDTTFVPKSGDNTWGLAGFFDSTIKRNHKGLELSLLSLVELDKPRAWALDALQTPAEFRFPKNRERHFLEQLRQSRPNIPESVRHLLADGHYSNFAFVHGVLQMGLHLVTKLRKDANMRYLYQGPYSGHGAPKQYDGKVDYQDFSRWDLVETEHEGLEVYTALVNHVHLKMNLRVVVVFPKGKPQSRRVLMSTDTELSGEQVFEWYKARFQIEYLFRDAKQHTGLCDGQMRSEQGLHFHFNASMSALNILRLQELQRDDGVCSISSAKRRNYNNTLIFRLFSKLGLDPTCDKYRPHAHELSSFGAIAA